MPSDAPDQSDPVGLSQIPVSALLLNHTCATAPLCPADAPSILLFFVEGSVKQCAWQRAVHLVVLAGQGAHWCKCRPFQQLLMDQGVLQLAASFLDPCHGAHVNLSASALLNGLAGLPGSGSLVLGCGAVQASTRTIELPSVSGGMGRELACMTVRLDCAM